MIRRISCGLKRDCSTGSNTAERGGSVVSGALIPCAIRHPPASIVQHTQRATRVTRIARRAKTGNRRGCRSLWPGVGDTEPERGGKGRNMLRYRTLSRVNMQYLMRPRRVLSFPAFFINARMTELFPRCTYPGPSARHTGKGPGVGSITRESSTRWYAPRAGVRRA